MRPLDGVTVAFLCLNESAVIAGAVRHFKDMGFKHIVVIDDGSTDPTAKEAGAAGATVIQNSGTLGFGLSMLKALHTVKTEWVIIIDPNRMYEPKGMKEFVDFAAIGNYSLFMSRGSSRSSRIFSLVLKRRYGIFIDRPGTGAILINRRLITALNNEISIGERYIFFELIRVAITNKYKLGVFPLRSLSGAIPGTRILSKAITWRLREISRDLFYFNYAFPNLQLRQAVRDISVGAAGIVLGILIPWLLSIFK